MLAQNEYLFASTQFSNFKMVFSFNGRVNNTLVAIFVIGTTLASIEFIFIKSLSILNTY